MTGADLITRCKIKIPAVKETSISDADLLVLINEAVVEINIRALVYDSYTNFNIVADQQVYAISQIAPNFQQVSTAGLWFTTDGTVTNMKRVRPRTKEWFNKKIPNWRAATSGTEPQYYYHDADDLVIYPPVSSSITNGGRLHHLVLPTDMTQTDQYPWSGSTTEFAMFRPLDNAIVEYVRWTLAPNLSQETGEDLTYKRFMMFVNMGSAQIKAKPDAINDYDTAISFST